MKTIKKTGRYLVFLLLVFLLLLNGITIVQSALFGQEFPMLFGYGKAVVVTGSMEPAIRPGDMVIVREQDVYDIGDIVLYKANSYITHRIVGKTEDGYITQGDANNTDDGEIQREQLVGKIILTIPKIGHVFSFLKTPLGILVLVTVLLILIEFPKLGKKSSKQR